MARLSIPNPVRSWQRMSPRRRSDTMVFYLWIMPWLAGFLIWQAWPLLQSIYLSFTNFRLLNVPEFTGTANVERLVGDERFWNSLKVTLLYVLGTVPIGTILALLVAMFLAQKLRGSNFWRTIYFMPYVVSAVAAAVMFSFIFNPDFGLLNIVLERFGIKGPGWIASETWALPSIIIVAWWRSMGGQMIIYLAGLKGIPQVLYEAAEIDGAGTWAKFRNVTIPMLSPTIFFNVVIMIINAFQVFDVPWTLTQGGPNFATDVYIIQLYDQALRFTNMGYASLLAWVLFLLILVLTLLVQYVSRNWVYYESEV